MNDSAGNQLSELNAKIRSLELELAERDRVISRLRADLENSRAYQRDLLQEGIASQQEGLFCEAAVPAAQFLTQAYLMEQKGVPVQARDVLAVTRRLVHALQNNGLTFAELPGQEVPYDPSRHIPLNAALELETGERVTVRFAAVEYQGKLLARASVERSGEPE